jgi:hypothetical protein
LKTADKKQSADVTRGRWDNIVVQFSRRSIMSIAGVLASSLFSGIGSQKVQNTLKLMQSKVGLYEPNIKTSDAQSTFESLQQSLMEKDPGGTPSSTIPPQGEVTQPGPGLTSGSLAAANGGSSPLQGVLPHNHLSHSHLHGLIQASGVDGNSGSTISAMLGQIDPSLQLGQLSVAQQAYSSLQQSLSGSALNSSLMTGASSFNVDA